MRDDRIGNSIAIRVSNAWDSTAGEKGVRLLSMRCSESKKRSCTRVFPTIRNHGEPKPVGGVPIVIDGDPSHVGYFSLMTARGSFVLSFIFICY